MSKEGQGGRNQSHNQPKEQAPHGGGIKSSERQPLSSVRDVLGRIVRLEAKDIEDRPRRESQEYKRELHEVKQLVNEIRKNGTPREKLTFYLYKTIVTEPTSTLPVSAFFRHPPLQKFQKFRSQVEQMSDEELTEEARKAEEELKRKHEERSKMGRKPPDLHVVSDD